MGSLWEAVVPAAPEETSSFILIVEDDLELGDSLGEVLAEEGYTCHTARNGLEAIEKLRAGLRPAAILLDLAMPLVSGWEFRLFQQRDPELEKIPVVLITAGVYPRQELEWLRPVAILQKPLHLDRLLEALRHHCFPATSPTSSPEPRSK